MRDKIPELIKGRLNLRLGINKISELTRLVYEIHRREKKTPENIISDKDITGTAENKSLSPADKFSKIKKYLLQRRFPLSCSCGQKDFSVFLNRLESAEDKTKVRTYSGKFHPEAIYIEKAARNSPFVEQVLRRFPGVKTEYISSIKEYQKEKQTSPYDLKKRDIFVSIEKTDFFKPCPCSRNVLPCEYHIFNLGFGCPYDCSYCYLQHYTNFPGIIFNANLEDFLKNLDPYLNKTGNRKIRIGSGEFTDSLALDNVTEYSKTLVPFFASKNVFFELKTKSANIENLIGLDHGGKTVVSWSLNPESIIEKEEPGTASLKERLDAAAKCRKEGYKVGFHFDPVIYYPGWEEDYREVVNELFDRIDEAVWISLGTLRFHRSLKQIIEQRFPESDYIYGELLTGQDKKMRYSSILRKEIFNKMIGWIRERNRGTVLYLCMEPADVWKETLGSLKESGLLCLLSRDRPTLGRV